MSKVVNITREQIDALRTEGLSLQKFADRLKVSLSSVKRFLREGESNADVLAFTKKTCSACIRSP